MRSGSLFFLVFATTSFTFSSVASAQDAPDESTKESTKQADAAAADEEAAVEGDEPSPSRPPPKGKGAIWGVVRSAGGAKDTLIEATVTVVGGKQRSLTDVDGRFRLELAPGSYELRVAYELHKARRVQNVAVAAGQLVRLDVNLDPDKLAEEETTAVEAEVERGTAASQLAIRKNAATVSDAVSAQDIARTPDRNAADAAKRVVGATVVDARYVYVRGLGERYTNALLNGAPLPSPEPDRQAVPLDLFPSLVISDITITKTFTPDMPGDFAGGSVNIHTRDLPPKFQLQSTLGVGLNSDATFAKRLNYQGGKLDFLGIDAGGRALPKDIPGDRIVRIDREGNVNPNITAYGRSINTPMTSNRVLSMPHGNGNIIVGDSLRFGANKDQVVGYQAALSYTRRFTRRTGETLRTFTIDGANNGALKRLNDYTAETGTDQVGWSGLGSLAYAPGRDHKVTFTGIYSRAAEKETREISGFNDERASNISDTRLRFVSRQLLYGQLRGEHRFPKVTSGTLGWNASASRATLDEPNTRETVYAADPTVGSTWIDATLSGSHFYAGQKERTYGGGLDWTQPLVEGKTPTTFKLGGLVNLKHRYFEARRFRFTRSGTDSSVYLLPPQKLFTDENIGTALTLEEYTRANDAYVADHNVFATYLMTDIAFTERLRFIAGSRIEASNQVIDSFDPLSPDQNAVRGQLKKTDVLPAANIVYKTTDASNLRLSVSQTVARPQLRELAPFSFTDYFGAREVQGNPNLDRTKIINGDLRYEWFPGASEVLAATVFFKSFSKPIEQIIIPTNAGVVSFQNAKSATNLGFELEARKGLGILGEALKEFTVLANVTFVYSRVALASGPGQVQTNNVRPLANQSPYIFNAALDYAHEATKTRVRLLYNVFGARIAQVGQLGLPDVFEQPRHQVDATVSQGLGNHFDAKLTADNILNTPVKLTQGNESAGDNTVQRFKYGTTVWLSLTYTN